ncbi:hypothetical protein OESDEN_05676 [Oesophagostomum dentatum]|uniref:Uncharacterized protein n=1 Tax=Oesophagostomum dentatum TaxID=61180 RepID=A0A0B1TEY9_OESDE|nr:hypothetical protein OESDEN_05676 [Oesophagostomum dentatum]
MRIARDLLKALQLDGGGGGGMSDSSSEEEEADEDDDPIRRIADRIGDGQIEDGEQAVVEEDPLNSGDDQNEDAMRIARDLLKALQLDGGGGGGMSDSSSEEEEVIFLDYFIPMRSHDFGEKVYISYVHSVKALLPTTF